MNFLTGFSRGPNIYTIRLLRPYEPWVNSTLIFSTSTLFFLGILVKNRVFGHISSWFRARNGTPGPNSVGIYYRYRVTLYQLLGPKAPGLPLRQIQVAPIPPFFGHFSQNQHISSWFRPRNGPPGLKLSGYILEA